MKKRSPDEIIVLGIIFLSLLGLVPFTFIRISMGEWLVASVDAFGALSGIACLVYVWRTGKITYIGALIAFASQLGMVINIHRLGPNGLYFLYPVVISAFFLLRPTFALFCTSMTTFAVTYFIAGQLQTLDTIKVFSSLLATVSFTFVFAWQRNSQRDALKALSKIDALTGAGNRRAMREQLNELVQLHARDKQPMSLIFLDLDDFKLINDDHGHLTGDEVLKSLARLIRSRIRSTDHLFRYGGDEFMILANHSDLSTTQVLADDIQHRITHDLSLPVGLISVSVGVSQYQQGESADQWLARADSAMYSAKRNAKM